jgi:cardiolipin synthase (CMP-forming)
MNLGKEQRAVLTYANQLTILRMIFIPCFVLLVIYGHVQIATLVFFLAGVTDALDGLIARKLQQKTALGSYLDPMADKLLLTASFVTLTVPSVPVALHIPIWLTVLTISRDLLIAVSALIIHLQTGHVSFPPSFLGKCTTTAQLTTVGVCIAGNFIPGLGVVIFPLAIYSTLLMTIGSGLHYFYRSVRIIEEYQKTQSVNGKKRSQDSRS